MSDKIFRKRFESNVDRSGDCWIWRGNIDSKGYGRISKNDRVEKAHRISYELYVGRIPKGLFVCHSCDNPPCVRPSHLWIGTNSQNQMDSVKKGWKNPNIGLKNGRCKLSDIAVISIRDLANTGSLSYSRLADKFGISSSQIRRIIKGLRWAHVTPKSKQALGTEEK